MPGLYREAAGWGEPPGPPRTSGTASWSVAAGVLSFTCLFGLGGALAITLGWIAHHEIERSGGRLSGKGLASAGIGLGIANLVLTIVGTSALIALAVRPEPPSSTLTPRPAPTFVAVPPAATTPTPLPTSGAPPPAAASAAAPGLPALPPRIGKIAIVEASAEGDALEAQLLSQLQEASQAGERLVLWTVTTECEPCGAVARALSDARMQRALAKVRLFRADTASFPRELRLLGIPGEQVPGFTLFDAQGRALDHIHDDEWDADVPANIAPILDKFLKRSLTERRHPWARPLRQGETPL